MKNNNVSQVAVAALISIVLLGGCATQPSAENVNVEAKTCCKKASDFPFRPLMAGISTDFKISEFAPTSELNGKLRHFASFKIPDPMVASALIVKSYLSTGFLPKATAIYPNFLFLDTNHKIIGESIPSNLRHESGFWRSAIHGRVIMPPESRYIVVFADNPSDGVFHVRSQNGTPHRISPATFGDLSITLYGELSRP